MTTVLRARALVACAGLGSVVLGALLIPPFAVQADEALPAVVHMTSVLNEELPLNPITGNRVRGVYRENAGSIAAIQIGDLARHTHETASEMFYIVDGTAQITVGDVKASVKPGDLMIVPKGALHSIKSDAGLLKAILITMPARDAADVHFVK